MHHTPPANNFIEHSKLETAICMLLLFIISGSLLLIGYIIGLTA